MNYNNIQTILRHETKIIQRTWLFRVLATFMLISIFGIQLTLQSDVLEIPFRQFTALPSYLPYFNIYLFGIFQVLIILFTSIDLATSIYKIESTETIYTRPLSNLDYMLGKALALLYVFMKLSACSLLLSALINILFSSHPFHPVIYITYWLLFPLPIIIFVTGLAFVITSFSSSKPLSIILLFGLLLLDLFLSNNAQIYLLDLWGYNMASIFSDFTGFPEMKTLLLQRLFWVFLGSSFIILAAALTPRQQNHPNQKNTQIILSVVFMFISGACIFTLNLEQKMVSSLRESYRETYRKYQSQEKLSLLEQSITYEQKQDHIHVTTILKLGNNYDKEIPQIILYLNPGLKIKQISNNNTAIPFTRENQVILIPHNIYPHDTTEITIEYNGFIDESICFIEFPEQYLLDSSGLGIDIFRPGKHFAYLEKNYTLLSPECIWYPTTQPPVNMLNKLNTQKDFTRFKLQINGERDRIVISQGKRKKQGDTIIFTNQQPLPGISLCIGEYDNYNIRLDSTDYELYLAKGNDYFVKFFQHGQEIIGECIREFREMTENNVNRQYPFERFLIVETPASFFSFSRIERNENTYIQPEIAFLPEKGVGFHSINLEKEKQLLMTYHQMESLDCEKKLLFNLFKSLFSDIYACGMRPDIYIGRFFSPPSNSIYRITQNPFICSPIFHQHVNYIHSIDYPFITTILNNIEKKNVIKKDNIFDIPFQSNAQKQAVTYLRTYSLQEALNDTLLPSRILSEIIEIKTTDLLGRYLSSIVSAMDLSDFIKNYWDKHPFQSVSFADFNQTFQKQFGQSLDTILPSWYKSKHIPAFIIQNESIQCIVEAGNKYTSPKGYRFYAEIYNNSDVDGVISITYSESNRANYLTSTENIAIKAKKSKSISYTTPNHIMQVSLNTIVSENLPTIITINRIQGTTTDTSSYVKTIPASRFFPKNGEIIVDDLSENFTILSGEISENKIQRWLHRKINQTSAEEFPEYYRTRPNDTWTGVLASMFHGKFIRTGHMKKSGSGESSVRWNTTITQAGHYEIFAYIPDGIILHELNSKMGSTKILISSESKDMEQTYIIPEYGQQIETTISLFPDNRGWVSLGRFYLSPGKTSVTLTDKGIENQIIYADAIKWVLITPD